MLRTLRHRRGPAGVLAGIALTAGLVAGPAPGAHAAPTDCPAGALCLFSEPGFRGELRVVYADAPGRVHDIESVFNNATCAAVFHDDMAGPAFVVPRGSAVPRAAEATPVLRDGAAFVRWAGCS
ncbi:peptidase inhibitor family I36 protein [Streptomyces sp. NPDC096191]|uniref:peptidase inhibitor family I36 protein n=1 Tax=Streptomyces sp. NPDC096191 TaxID=3155426 RepID=UPI0033204534